MNIIMNERKKRVLIIGATGFVGRRFCQLILDKQFRENISLTFTARNKKKFYELFPSIESDVNNIQFEQLDTFDKKQVNKLIERNDVVCNFVGPYAKYAHNIVESCAKNGVHYLDITGEINFIQEMIKKHEQVAIDNGASIIPFCGFDSVPSDLGVYLIKKKINKKYKEKIKFAHIIYQLKGGINGGTIASAFESLSTISQEDMLNLHYLTPMDHAFYPPLESKVRKDMDGVHVAPFFMEPINNKVIYRTKNLCNHEGYAKNFLYLESMKTTASFSFLSSQIVQKSLGFFDLLKKTSTTSRLMRAFLPKPGEGPKESQIKNGFFKAQVIGISESGRTQELYILGQGDPGNISTANLILLSLECLLKSKNPPVGFHTPVSCFGDSIEKNLTKYDLQIKDY